MSKQRPIKHKKLIVKLALFYEKRLEEEIALDRKVRHKKPLKDHDEKTFTHSSHDKERLFQEKITPMMKYYGYYICPNNLTLKHDNKS